MKSVRPRISIGGFYLNKPSLSTISLSPYPQFTIATPRDDRHSPQYLCEGKPLPEHENTAQGHDHRFQVDIGKGTSYEVLTS